MFKNSLFFRDVALLVSVLALVIMTAGCARTDSVKSSPPQAGKETEQVVVAKSLAAIAIGNGASVVFSTTTPPRPLILLKGRLGLVPSRMARVQPMAILPQISGNCSGKNNGVIYMNSTDGQAWGYYRAHSIADANMLTAHGLEGMELTVLFKCGDAWNEFNFGRHVGVDPVSVTASIGETVVRKYTLVWP